MVAAFLAIAAFVLAGTFIEYRVQPIRACSGSFDVICMAPDQLITLGMVGIDPEPGSVLAKYHGKTQGDRGLYSRFNIPLPLAAVIGLLLPLASLIAALVLILRHSSGTNRRTIA
jgi:hypothetical protein